VDGAVERLIAPAPEPALEDVAGWGRYPVGRGLVVRRQHQTLPAGAQRI
jgi:hypothetical protein